MQAFIYKLSNKNFLRTYSRKKQREEESKRREERRGYKDRVRKTSKQKIVRLIKFKQMLISNKKK